MKKYMINISLILTVCGLIFFGSSITVPSLLHSAYSTEQENHDEHDDHEHSENEESHEEAEMHEDHDHDKHSENGQAGHTDEHEGHDEHDEALRFSPEALKEFSIETKIAQSGAISKTIKTSGEITPNPDLVSHIVPRVSGVVREVKKSLGDFVEEEELLAILESRELASLKSNFLSSVERLTLAQEIFDREKGLWVKKISAEQEYLEAKQKLAEAKISVNAAEQQLHAVGFTQPYIDALPNQPDALITRYEVRAPFAGRITEKHITLGEYVKDEDSIFTVSNLNRVWVNLTIYQKDLPHIHTGQAATISFQLSNQHTSGEITYISPTLDQHTRTGTARVVVDNTNGIWRPGMFINALIATDESPISVFVPQSAVLTINNHDAVFIQTDEGFKPQPVMVGRKDEWGVEILSGLEQGQIYVSSGGFSLKAEMEKEAFAHSGHAH